MFQYSCDFYQLLGNSTLGALTARAVGPPPLQGDLLCSPGCPGSCRGQPSFTWKDMEREEGEAEGQKGVLETESCRGWSCSSACPAPGGRRLCWEQGAGSVGPAAIPAAELSDFTALLLPSALPRTVQCGCISGGMFGKCNYCKSVTNHSEALCVWNLLKLQQDFAF